MSERKDEELTDIDARRLEAASQWLLRFNGQPMSEQDMAEWIQWCDADAANLPAFERIRSTWERFGGLHGQHDASGSSWRGSRSSCPVARWGRLRRLALGSAALIMLVVGLAIYGLSHRPGLHEIASDHGNEAAVLPDGSSLQLSGRSRIAVDFTSAQRGLTLYPGRAYFNVRADKKRPFVVHAGDFDVAAVGTRFDVHREADSTTVTVEEGAVRIARAGGSGGSWQLGAGFQFVSSSNTQRPTIVAVDTPDALAWREGRLVYESESLGQIVRDVNRYSAHRVMILDPTIASLAFSGTVFTASIDDWLASVTTAFRLQAVVLPNGDTLLERAEK